MTDLFAAGWSWASGGVVATPADLDRFIRGLRPGRRPRAPCRPRASSSASGRARPSRRAPATNAAGLGIFRYRTRCGTVFGHTGNTSGYTQFAAATADGSRSVVVSVNAQITPRNAHRVFAELRTIETLAVCTALAP